MLWTALTLSLLAVPTPGVPTQEPAATEERFPTSSALAEGVSPEALDKLNQLVQSLVDDDEIVGAELLVIKSGKSILHEAYGMNDRESERPMETGSVFCVRSMTKPLIGTAILMLVDDKLIKLSDPIAKYIPSFDVEGSRDITVEHLITHTSGLPMSLLIGQDLASLEGIRGVAELGAGHSLEFEPGSGFNYSDQGTDTLTALIEVASGMPAAEFVRTRVLDPLGMHESACVLTEDHPLLPRACSLYIGSRNNWSRFWTPGEESLFPFFLGSQGLYSTLEDYARFTEFWSRKGRGPDGRLLGARFVKKALNPGPHPMNSPSGLPGLVSNYGMLMQLWTEKSATDEVGEVVAFGHTGSDGTHAWVFPDQKAMVFYFTQSRGNITGLRVEEVLGELFLGVPFDPNQAAPPFEEYLGYYWEGEDDVYRAIIRDGEDLALEVLGRGVVPLTYIGEDRWKMRPNPSVVLAFDRSETGEVTGYHIGDHQEFRFEPSPELPSADEIAERVVKAHRIDLIESLGPIRIEGTLDIESVGITGTTSTLLAWPGRLRVDTVAGGQSEHVVIDGERIRYSSTAQPAKTPEGPLAEAMRLDTPFVHFGDWREWYSSLQVIQRIKQGSEEVFLVRAGDTSATAPTLYVHATTGHLVHVAKVTPIEGMGRMGQHVSFGDFRDVSGMSLPHKSEVKLANPMIGSIVSEVTEIELGVELPEDAFVLED